MVDVASLDELTDRPQARPFPGAEPDAVRLALDAGEAVPPHSHPERQILFHVLSGEIELSLDGDVHVLEANDLVRFDGQREVAPTAREDSVALVVLARRTE